MAEAPPAWILGLPDHGYNFTKGYQYRAKGALDPRNVKLPQPFIVAVTGAGRGIGASIAKAYAHAGASGIAITCRTLTDLQHVAEEIHQINPQAKVVYQVSDVRKESDLASFASKVHESFGGRLDVAVINAGVVPKFLLVDDGKTKRNRWPQSLVEDTSDDFLRVWNTNFTGAYLASRAFLPLVRDTKDGAQALLFTSSSSSLFETGEVTPLSYDLSKLSVNRLAEFIHHAHHKEGIVTYAFHPGGIKTPMTTEYPREWDASK